MSLAIFLIRDPQPKCAKQFLPNPPLKWMSQHQATLSVIIAVHTKPTVSGKNSLVLT